MTDEYIFHAEGRKELIEKLGTREDNKFKLFDLQQLEEIIKAEDNENIREGWYCLGRQYKKEHVNYCIYAYRAFENNKPVQPVKNCTADCEFYKKIHKIPWYKKLVNFIKTLYS